MQLPQIDPAAGPQFTVGGVLNRAWTALLKNPGIFFGLTVVAMLPATLLALFLPSVTQSALLIVYSVAIVQTVLLMVSEGAVAYALSQSLRGEPISFMAAVSRGLARFLPIFVASLLVGLGVGLGFIVIIPGLVLLCMWVVTIPVCAVERLGATESIGRSMKLTEGHRWKIFALVCILWVAIQVISYSTVFLAGLTGSTTVMSIAVLLLCAVPQAFSSLVHATIYYDLKRTKEGVSVDALTGVFD